jgi:UDP-glucose 4-epimerase
LNNKTLLNKVLVTGATGFIGSRLLERLKIIDCEVRVLSRNTLIGYDSICCDLQQDLIPKFALNSIDSIFHIAGVAHDFQNNTETELMFYKVNVEATINLAKLAIKSGVKRFIFVSSVKAGGKSDTSDCMNEINQFEPEGIYGQTKREAEIKLLALGQESNMHVVIVRPALVYGPGMKGNLKVMFDGVSKGWFPPLPDTGNLRSMIHVDDLVNALVMVALDVQTNGNIFIATDGKPYSSRKIYEAMLEVIGKDIPKWYVPTIFFDILSKINVRLKYKIQKLLGNECYSSKKLESIGFRAKNSIKQMNHNETFI